MRNCSFHQAVYGFSHRYLVRFSRILFVGYKFHCIHQVA